MSTHRIWSATVVTAAVAVLLAPAYADDIKVISGVACRAASPTNQDDLDYAFDGVKNAAGSDRTVECPMLSDHETNDDGLLNVYVTVIVSSGTVDCTLRSVSADGTVQDSGSGSSSGTGARTINLGDNPNQSLMNGFYALSCVLPSQAKLTGIRYTEIE